MHFKLVRLRDLGESYLEPRRRQSSVLLRGSKAASSLWEPSGSRPKSSQHTVSKPFSVLSLQESTKSIGWFFNLVVASSVSDETYFKLRLFATFDLINFCWKSKIFLFSFVWQKMWDGVSLFGLHDWFCWKKNDWVNDAMFSKTGWDSNQRSEDLEFYKLNSKLISTVRVASLNFNMNFI